MSLYHEIWLAEKYFVLALDLATWNKTLQFCPSTFYRLNISRLKKLVLPLSQFQSEQRDAWRVKWELDFPTFPQENKIWVTWLGFRQNKQTGGWDLGRIWARKCDLYPPDPVPQKPQRTQTFFFLLFWEVLEQFIPYTPLFQLYLSCFSLRAESLRGGLMCTYYKWHRLYLDFFATFSTGFVLRWDAASIFLLALWFSEVKTHTCRKSFSVDSVACKDFPFVG